MVTEQAIAFRHPRYEAGPELGRGLQGAVLRVRDREDPERALVAKVYRAGVLSEEALRGEFALLARLRAPCLVRAHDLGRNELDGAPFLVEDLIDGPDACAWLQESTEARAQRLRQLLAGTARALAALHEAGFLHGDLKPAHVRIERGSPVLLDLGAASRWAAGEGPRVFTHAYAAPEVRAAGRSDARADLFGLGALAWAAAIGGPPPSKLPALRGQAPWVPPRIADIIEALLAPHPEDRPNSALEVLLELGQVASPEGSLPRPIGRERELAAAISGDHSRVRYLVGPSGSGKTHLLRELHVALLLLGRQVRWLSIQAAAPSQLSRWVAFLRGSAEAPIALAARAAPCLLLVDSLDDAPRELAEALDAYRLRFGPAPLQVLVAARTAPLGAASIELGPIGAVELSGLARALGAKEHELERLALGAAGNPGWLVATLGRVPLRAEAVLDRARTLQPHAVQALAAVAAVGGIAPEAWLPGVVHEPAQACSALLEAALLRRKRTPTGIVYELEASAAGETIARALALPALLAALRDRLLADADTPPRALLALAAQTQGESRTLLLWAAAAGARAVQARDSEIDALLALGNDDNARSYALLARLERLLRDAGRHEEHARVVGWLDSASERDARLEALALRRRAEQRAREGDQPAALALADRALVAAEALSDPLFQALALATKGAVQLYAAQHAAAFAALSEARSRLNQLPACEDREELARLDHNLGVVAVYRGQLDEAIIRFGEALAVKQALGDRAGVRACLRNLGYAMLRAGRYDEAAPFLQEALALARSLRQAAGLAWSLVCLAELEARRGRREPAAGYLAEADALGAEVPAAVRADAALVRAELALSAQDRSAFDAALASIEPALRAGDAQVDTSCVILLARAALAMSGSPLSAARLAIDAVRRARAASLVLAAREAVQVLQAALARRHSAPRTGRSPDNHDPWAVVDSLCRASATTTYELLARHALAVLGAERVFVVPFHAHEPLEPYALDCDGMPLADAARRMDLSAVRAALHDTGGPVASHDNGRLPVALHGTGRLPVALRRAFGVPVRTELADGRGVRIALASNEVAPDWRLVVMAEHRFVSGAFDHVTPQCIESLQTLATLALRFASPVFAEAGSRAAPDHATHAATPASESRPLSTASLARADSTAVPLRSSRRSFPGIMGSSRALRAALARLDAAIDSELPILLTGETGVGKELFARAVSELGPRAGRPFIAVNCGAIPEPLFEAELFGHERGAFTGADRRRPGLLAQAHGGVLLLDEVGELGLGQQVALLRALETRRMRAVGADVERAFDVRIVAATNRDLQRAVGERTFRQDLLYRLNVLEIRVPSLADRVEDIEMLALHYLRATGNRAEIAPAAHAALLAYDWPGNVRELAHVMQRLSMLGAARIELAHLPRHLRGSTTKLSVSQRSAATRLRPGAGPKPDAVDDPKAEVLAALAKTGNNISHAARVLGLTRHGLKKRMLRLGLRGQASRGEL
jgi:DNA-binding NtrC family response regulator/tetratricopeptide (TPR) repeat protein